MAFLTGSDLAVRLIEALGLQHQHVRSITVHAVVGEVGRVVVEHFVTEEQADAVAGALAATRGRVQVEVAPAAGPEQGGAYHVYYHDDGQRRQTVRGPRAAADAEAYRLACLHANEGHPVILTDAYDTALTVCYPDGIRVARGHGANSWVEGRWRDAE